MTASEEKEVLARYGELIDRILVLTDALRAVTFTPHFHDMEDSVQEQVNKALKKPTTQKP